MDKLQLRGICKNLIATMLARGEQKQLAEIKIHYDTFKRTFENPKVMDRWTDSQRSFWVALTTYHTIGRAVYFAAAKHVYIGFTKAAKPFKCYECWESWDPLYGRRYIWQVTQKDHEVCGFFCEQCHPWIMKGDTYYEECGVCGSRHSNDPKQCTPSKPF